MYKYIVRVKFITVDVNRYLFYRIFKRKTVQVLIPKTMINYESLNDPEFVRFKYCGNYLDIKIIKIEEKRGYLIHVGQIIDSSISQRNIKLK